MFLVNKMKATLRQYNRKNNDEFFDDTNYREINIWCCPYDKDDKINFSEYTTNEATGYYQVSKDTDIRVGDQIKFEGTYNSTPDDFHTVLEVKDEWIFNHIENKIAAVK